jgi:hypothetical protein
MRTLRTITLGVGVALHVACFAQSNELQTAILSFPRVTEYRPDEAARIANKLMEAGKDAACNALERAAKEHRSDGWIDERVCHLCRLIFVPSDPSKPLRSPGLGVSTTMPYESLKPPEWPDLPFTIVNGIPICVYPGYGMGGMSERGVDYVAYCRTNGAFRAEPFSVGTALSVSNALDRLFDSAAWKALKWQDEGVGWHYTLDESYAKERLQEQVARMTNQPVQRTGASHSAQETNRASGAAGPRR